MKRPRALGTRRTNRPTARPSPLRPIGPASSRRRAILPPPRGGDGMRPPRPLRPDDAEQLALDDPASPRREPAGSDRAADAATGSEGRAQTGRQTSWPAAGEESRPAATGSVANGSESSGPQIGALDAPVPPAPWSGRADGGATPAPESGRYGTPEPHGTNGAAESGPPRSEDMGDSFGGAGLRPGRSQPDGRGGRAQPSSGGPGPQPSGAPSAQPPAGGQPAGNQPGGNQPGGNQPGGNQPGGNPQGALSRPPTETGNASMAIRAIAATAGVGAGTVASAPSTTCRVPPPSSLSSSSPVSRSRSTGCSTSGTRATDSCGPRAFWPARTTSTSRSARSAALPSARATRSKGPAGRRRPTRSIRPCCASTP